MIGRDTMAGRNVPPVHPKPPPVPAWCWLLAAAMAVTAILLPGVLP